MPASIGAAFDFYVGLHATWQDAVGKNLGNEDPYRFVRLLESGLNGTGLTQTELAEATGYKQSWLSKLTVKLEEAGFVIRRRDPDNYRARRLVTTEKGRELLISIWMAFHPYDRRLKPLPAGGGRSSRPKRKTGN